MTKTARTSTLLTLVLCLPASAFAQIVEAVGSRALGMGGAFVAVANDSSATWWNPAGLAPGPFLDLAFGWSSTDIEDGLPARRDRAAGFALTTPPLGVSYYRFRVTNIGRFSPIEGDEAGREDRRVAVPAWSLSASQFGVTLVQSVVSGIHVGTTLKYVRAVALARDIEGPESQRASEWLDQAGRLDSGGGQGSFDLDLGALAVYGPVRLGGVVRNVRAPESGPLELPRQVRFGLALDVAEAGGPALMLAFDADARSYDTPFGDRRVVALGAESWLTRRRVGLRVGARFNTVGAEERAITAGASVQIRSGLVGEGYVAGGGSSGEGGWGLGARASF